VAGPDKQLLSKNPSFTPFLRSLQETFPDGRFLCCVREPLQVVPSLLSSIRTGAEIFGYDPSDPKIRDRFVAMLEFFANHALATLEETPEEKHAFVPMNTMKVDVKGFVLGIYEKFGWDPDPGFQKRLAEESTRGRGYKSKHSYSLEEFGLTEDEIRQRFTALNARFGFGGDST